MKATLTKTFFQVKKMYKPDDALILEWKVYDLDLLTCDENEDESIDIRIYKRGKAYSCCIWIRRHKTIDELGVDGRYKRVSTVDLAGSGKDTTSQHAIINALRSIGITFDSEVPMIDPFYSPRKMVETVINAVSVELGIKYKKVAEFSR